jgi:hypothetical protein
MNAARQVISGFLSIPGGQTRVGHHLSDVLTLRLEGENALNRYPLLRSLMQGGVPSLDPTRFDVAQEILWASRRSERGRDYVNIEDFTDTIRRAMRGVDRRAFVEAYVGEGSDEARIFGRFTAGVDQTFGAGRRTGTFARWQLSDIWRMIEERHPDLSELLHRYILTLQGDPTDPVDLERAVSGLVSRSPENVLPAIEAITRLSGGTNDPAYALGIGAFVGKSEQTMIYSGRGSDGEFRFAQWLGGITGRAMNIKLYPDRILLNLAWEDRDPFRSQLLRVALQQAGIDMLHPTTASGDRRRFVGGLLDRFRGLHLERRELVSIEEFDFQAPIRPTIAQYDNEDYVVIPFEPAEFPDAARYLNRTRNYVARVIDNL